MRRGVGAEVAAQDRQAGGGALSVDDRREPVRDRAVGDGRGRLEAIGVERGLAARDREQREAGQLLAVVARLDQHPGRAGVLAARQRRAEHIAIGLPDRRALDRAARVLVGERDLRPVERGI